MADSLIDKIKQKKLKTVQTSQSEDTVSQPNSTATGVSSTIRSNSSKENVTTAKPKLLTLEESIHARVEQICFENPSVSRDTLIEALLIVAERSGQLPQAIELASERLVQRKRSAVRRRAKTMAENLEK
ncbi:MAG: hypothetical protein QNJ41_12025 [Xenococcaceae cyanobacterium MO_188.B32]|nr:hypothetical protein [Xenococcaceae cyanobacterium MO_188.B32]